MRESVLRCPLRAVLVLVSALSVAACGYFHSPPGSSRPSEKSPAPIDLNRASQSKIEALPGVTPSMAKRIVDGRPYEDVEDLVRRDIITRRELERIENRITIDRPPD
jgi:competence protein ComEA